MSVWETGPRARWELSPTFERWLRAFDTSKNGLFLIDDRLDILNHRKSRLGYRMRELDGDLHV